MKGINFFEAMWLMVGDEIMERIKGDNKMTKGYNGPHTAAADFFIKCVDERFKKRPWNPVQELLIMRILETTIDEFNVMVGREVK